MESYLRRNAGVRWSLIAVLLLAILAEGVIVSRPFLASETTTPTGGEEPFGGGDITPEAAPVTLACTVLDGVNLRSSPAVQPDNLLATLAAQTPFTAIGRSGDVPWLQVRLADGREGWLSSRLGENEPLVQCDGDLQSLPEVGAPTAAANSPEQPSPTPPPTPAPAPTLTPDANARLRVGNGPDLHAARRTFEVALDGDLAEWASRGGVSVANPVFQRENWSGPADSSAIVRAAWDDEFLYLAAQVADEVVVQESREDQLYRGDAIELFLDGDLVGDFDVDRYTDDDWQMIFSPGNFEGRAPATWVYYAPTGNFREQIAIEARRTASGYDLEMRVPWSGLRFTPRAGTVLGYALAVSDDDSPGGGDQETQVATTRDTPFQHPTRWGNFVLDP